MGESNKDVYEAGIQKLVRSTMMGYNGTVFAYGQTASGKTYTMGTEKEPGVIPKAVKEVFSYIEEDTSGREYLLRVSYMEIYNEKIKDLLEKVDTYPDIVEDKKKGVYVRNLKEQKVSTPSEVMQCIKTGEGNRHISATDYNDRSSRSHTVFQLVIESTQKSNETKTNSIQISQLNLIDLAGSEKVASDLKRRKEGAYINKSLLTLGNVISKLTSDEPTSHVPFRDSKLTRILQAALSGNARISVICTINPTVASKDESLNTLKFAQRTKQVKTDAKMTKIGDNSELQHCLRTIAELQMKMQEKTDIEAETKLKLQQLLSLVLTSSKEKRIDINIYDSTVDEVVAFCREKLQVEIKEYRKEIKNLEVSVEQFKNKIHVLDDVLATKIEVASKRDAQIELLTEKHDISIGHLKEVVPASLAEDFETLFLWTQQDQLSKAKENIRNHIILEDKRFHKDDSRRPQSLSKKYQTVLSENDILKKKMDQLQNQYDTMMKRMTNKENQNNTLLIENFKLRNSLEEQQKQQILLLHEQEKQQNETNHLEMKNSPEIEPESPSTKIESTLEISTMDTQENGDNQPELDSLDMPIVIQNNNLTDLYLNSEHTRDGQPRFVGIQEAASFITSEFSMYQPIIQSEKLPELVADPLELCSSSNYHSCWDDRKPTESEGEELKPYEPYSKPIQQCIFYMPKFVWISLLVYLLFQL
ncbi:kinesin motor domain-containing protein [Sporodiniella umbellata]|nr:kinesin motor domain-containing protein [Sporodiniella umbellata]